MDNYSQTFLTKNQERMDTQKEQFKITKVSINNNKFDISIKNTGDIPVNLTKLYVQNTTNPTDWFAKYDVNSVVAPAQTVTNIGSSMALSALPSQSYSMKLVTERGNSQEFFVGSSSNIPVPLQMFVIPTTIPSGFTTNILMAVTNNMTSGTLTNVIPSISIISQGATAVLQSGPTPASYDSIQTGNTAYFEWTYLITGPSGSSVTFNATLQNAYPGNFVTGAVTVVPVSFASASTTALTSKGLSALSTSDSQLNFHKETTDALDGKQMYSVNPDASGQIIQLDTTSPIFYTNNDTTTETIAAGKWNVTLRYLSSPVPSSIPNQPDLVYHFESAGTTTKDSSGNNEDLNIIGGPTFGPNLGTNSSNTFVLNGNSQYFARNQAPDSHSNPNLNSVTSTAGWFKTSGSITNHKSIFHVGNAASKPFYDVSLSAAGKVVFRFSGKSDGSSPTSCISAGSTRYDDQQWHHFVAIKTSSSTCSLYVDNLSATTTSITGCTSSCTNAPPGNYYVGYDPLNQTNFFPGTIDDIIHWNNYQLSSAQVTDLVSTSYGVNAHTVTFTLDVVDKSGNFLRHINTTSISNVPFSFQDSFGAYPSISASSSSWNYQNFTMSLPAVALDQNERIKFQIKFVNPVHGLLPIKFDIDNTNISGLDSGIQIPSPSAPLPGYFVCNGCSDEDGTVYVYNLGPYKAWLTQSSRVTFETYDGTSVYASWVTGFSGFSHGISSDSTPIDVGTSVPISFSIPHTGPGLDPSGNSGAYGQSIPPGHYRMYIYLNGYDQKGNVLLGTQYVGPVKVT